MNGEELYLIQKNFMVRKFRSWLKVKKEKLLENKLKRKEKIVDIFNSRDALTVANFFSYLRIVFALLIIMALSSSNNILITTLFTLGLLTDWLDGIFAEVYDETTEIGKIIDPTADKFLIIGALWPFLNEINWFITDLKFLQPIWLLMYIEAVLMLSAFSKPYLNKKYGLNFRTGANIWGKAKMICESITVYLVLFFDFTGLFTSRLIVASLLICILLALISLFRHWRIKPANTDT